MNSDVIARSTTQPRNLTDEEIREIEHEKTLYPDKQAVGLEALKIVQKHQGWVSDESLLAIARYLDLPASELEGVATFFNLIYRKPVGRQVILLCDSVSCWIMGCESMRARIREILDIDYGETTADGAFTLIPVPCLGDCDHAPVMMVNADLHRDLTHDSIDKIIDSYRKSSGGSRA